MRLIALGKNLLEFVINSLIKSLFMCNNKNELIKDDKLNLST